MAKLLLLVIQDCAPPGSQAKVLKVVVILMDLILRVVVLVAAVSIPQWRYPRWGIYDGDIDRTEY